MKALDPSALNLTSAILGHKLKSVYLASPHEGAGTTTCAYSLAKALSPLISENVILIDGNPGPRCLTRVLNLANNTEGEDIDIPNPNTSDQTKIRAIAHEDFHLILADLTSPSLPIDGERTEIKRLIENLIENYGYVVIYDAPPIHNQNNSLSLAATFDGVIMIVNNNDTRIEVATSAKEKLTQAGANVIGAVFNRRRYYVPQKVYDLLY